MRSLYDEVGGEAPLAAAVDELYERLTRDERVAHHFPPERLDSLRAGQRRWFTANLGGPPPPDVPDLGAAHAAVAITDEQVAIVVGHLADSLRAAGVADDVAARVVAVVARLWYSRHF